MRMWLLANDLARKAVTGERLTLSQGHSKRNRSHARDTSRVFIFGPEYFDAMPGRLTQCGFARR